MVTLTLTKVVITIMMHLERMPIQSFECQGPFVEQPQPNQIQMNREYVLATTNLCPMVLFKAVLVILDLWR